MRQMPVLRDMIKEATSSYDVSPDFGTFYDAAPVYAVRPDIAVYGSLGRTISAGDANSASLIASAGISFGLKHP